MSDKFKTSFIGLIQDVENEAKLYNFFLKKSDEESFVERLQNISL